MTQLHARFLRPRPPGRAAYSCTGYRGRGPPAGRTGFPECTSDKTGVMLPTTRLHHPLPAAAQDACVDTPRPTTRQTLPLHALAATGRTGCTLTHARLLFLRAKLVGVPNPYFQLLISNSRPILARFTAKLACTNLNHLNRLTIRRDRQIRPKILYRR